MQTHLDSVITNSPCLLRLIHTARDRDRDRDREIMGFCIVLYTVHTTQGQGQVTIVFYCTRPSASPCSVPGPVQCEWAIRPIHTEVLSLSWEVLGAFYYTGRRVGFFFGKQFREKFHQNYVFSREEIIVSFCCQTQKYRNHNDEMDYFFLSYLYLFLKVYHNE